jgi:MSHA biogenesis protein MshN
MSLINKMLQDLDARGSDSMRAGSIHSEVRAVPEQRKNHLGWWVALVLAVLLGSGASWIWLRAAGPTNNAQDAPVAATLPLKFASDLSTSPQAAVQQPAIIADSASAASSEYSVPRDAAAPEIKPIIETPVSESLPSVAPKAATVLAANAEPRPASAKLTPIPLNSPAPVVATLPVGKKPERSEAPKAIEHPAQTGSAKHVRELTAAQRAENEYRRATLLVAQGKSAEAAAVLEQALSIDPHHTAARQTLVGLLLDGRRQDEALHKLQQGLTLDTSQTGLAMILARLQVERGEVKAAVESLQRSLPHATERADYQAFLAALLQRQEQHDEAIEHYALALRMTPQNAVWWMGLGISLQAQNRLPEARDAFGRAKAFNALSPELQAFVEQKLGQLSR